MVAGKVVSFRRLLPFSWSFVESKKGKSLALDLIRMNI